MMLLALGLMNVQAESVCLFKGGCITGTGILYVCVCSCWNAIYEMLFSGITAKKL